MGQDTYSDDTCGTYDTYGDNGDDGDRSQPEAYWRRRVITLCGGLALLALLAWAFSGGGKAPNGAHPASQGAGQGTSQAGGVLPAAAYSRSPASPAPGATGTNGSSSAASSASVGSAATLPFPVTSSRGGQPGSGQPGSGSPNAKSTHAAAAKARAGNAGGGSGVEPDGSCAPGSIVLSLFASRTAYYGGQYPAFQIDAVSTASRTCSFDISPHRLHVQVMSKGRVIWDSADCSRGEPNRPVQFRRGVPAETSVTWRRIVSLPGCITVASSARPGSYQVQARDSSVASPVRSFKLVR
jgi:hypothetical protein